MKIQHPHLWANFRAILERKEAELVWTLRNGDGIAIEKSTDQTDEIQYASERDLAICNVDRHSTLLREVKAAGFTTAALAPVSSVNAQSARSVSRPCHGQHGVSGARTLPIGTGGRGRTLSRTISAMPRE